MSDAAGEVDPELALSYVLWPTERMLRAVAAMPNLCPNVPNGLDAEPAQLRG